MQAVLLVLGNSVGMGIKPGGYLSLTLCWKDLRDPLQRLEVVHGSCSGLGQGWQTTSEAASKTANFHGWMGRTGGAQRWKALQQRLLSLTGHFFSHVSKLQRLCFNVVSCAPRPSWRSIYGPILPFSIFTQQTDYRDSLTGKVRSRE